MSGTLRLRMFAGPNGSGKTTVKNNLGKPAQWFGIYFNPDELEDAIRRTGTLSLSQFELAASTSEIQAFFANSPLLKTRHPASGVDGISCQGNLITFKGIEFDSYYASVLADFLRRKAIAASRSFSFETVMSAPDKVELLREAQGHGFRTYLYYIATEDPAINIQRVKNRVADGGHAVPEQKIIDRYFRSIQLLARAIRYTNRAFIFDTSEVKPRYFAEVTDGTRIELKSDEIPTWFQPIWEGFSNPRPS